MNLGVNSDYLHYVICRTHSTMDIRGLRNQSRDHEKKKIYITILRDSINYLSAKHLNAVKILKPDSLHKPNERTVMELYLKIMNCSHNFKLVLHRKLFNAYKRILFLTTF